MKFAIPYFLLSLGLSSLFAAEIPRPKPVEAVTEEALQQSIDQGIAFLVADQNKNGSWGNATKTKGLNIYAPVPGAHHAMRTGVTGLSIMGLCRNNPSDPKAIAAIEKSEKWLMDQLPRLRRADPTTTYNVWGHAYGIRALVALADYYKDDAEKVASYKKLADSQVALLFKQQEINGGWGYLDFDLTTQRPSGSPTSFTTATVLIAVHEAHERFGTEIPKAGAHIALRQIKRQRTPDGAFVYAEGHRNRPRYGINRPGGSLARSQVCNVALYEFGETKLIDQTDLDDWLDRLWARIGWIDIARKRPVPHETWFSNSGYFFFYGIHYAAMANDLLEDEERRKHHANHLATVLFGLQEKNGCWWDYPLYDYHRPYGTGYSLTALARCKQNLFGKAPISE